MSERALKVVRLGLQRYEGALKKQHDLSRIILQALKTGSDTSSLNTLLLVEHPPVYTVGMRNKNYNVDEDRLQALGADFFRTKRGGLITFHGPGQLVAYPIINLKDFHLGMRNYITAIEQTVIKTCSRLGVAAQTTCDTGVWVGDSKIAAIGQLGRHIAVFTYLGIVAQKMGVFIFAS